MCPGFGPSGALSGGRSPSLQESGDRGLVLLDTFPSYRFGTLLLSSEGLYHEERGWLE